MNKFKVRAYTVGAVGFLTQADHYEDFDFETDEAIESFASRLASKGFFDEGSHRWIMPGSIVWIEQK